MFEDSVSSTPTFWGSIYSWFTPSVFFLLLQLVIGTIFIISNLATTTHKQHQQDPQPHDFQQHQQQNQLARSPSLLQRLKSINFYSYPYRSQDPPQNPHFHNNPQFQIQTHEREHEHQLARSPSMLQRLKSINLYSYFPTEPFSSKLTTDTNTSYTTTTHVPEKPHVREESVIESEEEKEEDDDFVIEEYSINHEDQNYNYNLQEEGSSLDEIYSQLQGQDSNFKRTHSDTKPDSGEVPAKLPSKMKKSASSKSAFSHFREEDIVENRRPATMREGKVSGGGAVDDDEVDAKADDFINKFKQQLKLQRRDSIMRYKEMIGRGTAK